jgi:DNA-binding XRE family transcriptional regulator
VQISVRQPDKSGETSFFATFNRQGLDNSPFIRQYRNGVWIRESTMNMQLQLGARIRDLRAKKGWSQEHLADEAGLHRSHMGEIERGKANVTLTTLALIAKTLHVTPAELLQDLSI